MSGNISLDVPSLVSVEYPLRVKNTVKAIELVGGSEKLKKCFIEPDMKLQLKLRPDDPRSHPIHSTVLKNSSNVLLKISLPKRILKMFDRNIQDCIKYCEDHGIKYLIESSGILKQNYKFRELADFQKIGKNSAFNKEFDESVKVGNFQAIKKLSQKLHHEMNDKIQKFEDGDLDLPSLIRYSRTDINHSYKYYGNLLLDESGEWMNKSVKLYATQIKWNDPIPTEHDPNLHIEYEKAMSDVVKLRSNPITEKIINDSPSFNLVECIKILRLLFDMKPIWVRKQIHWMIPKSMRPQLRFALPFVAYSFSKGPWRHSFIKFGYDPRVDKSSYIYQIEAFRGIKRMITDEDIENIIESENEPDMYILPPTLKHFENEFNNSDSEICKLGVKKIPKQLFFDGKNPCNVIGYQVGDLMDDDLIEILKSGELENECRLGTGWINWIVLARIRSIIKYKLNCFRQGVNIDEKVVKEMTYKTSFSNTITAGFWQKGDEKKGDINLAEEEEDEADIDEDIEQDEDEDEDEFVEEEDADNEEEEIPNDDVIQRITKLTPKSVDVIKTIERILKQEEIMADSLQDSNEAGLV